MRQVIINNINFYMNVFLTMILIAHVTDFRKYFSYDIYSYSQ